VAKSYGGISVDITGNYENKDIKRAIADLKALDTSGKQTQDSMRAFKSLSATAKLAIAGFTAGAGASLVAFAVKAINAASDVEELGSKVEQIFGEDAAAQIQEWSTTTTENFGISGAAALEAAGNFGVFGKAAGLTGDELVGFSTELIELSADMASFNNATIEETIQAIGAGLRGEAEPLRRFGVLLDDATLRAKAMEMGIYSGSGALTQQQKVLAAHQVILAQTTDQQGDFERTSDGLANQQRILQARFADVTAQIGAALLPATLEIVSGFSDLFKGVEDLVSALTGGGGLASALQDSAKDVRTLFELTGDLASNLSNLGDSADEAERENKGFADSLSELFGRQNALIPVFNTFFNAYQANNAVTEYAEKVTDQYADALARLEGGAARTQQALYRTADATNAAASAIERYEQSTGVQVFQIKAANKLYQDAGVRAQRLSLEMEEAAKSTAKLGGSSSSAGSSVNELATRIEEARGRAKSAIADMTAELRSKLEESRQQFQDYATSVSRSIVGAINFRDAAPTFDEEGNRVGLTFIEALQEQATKAQEFATKVKTLIAMGLSQEALQQVLQAGVTAGTNIANELISGGSTAIEQTNELVNTTQAAADEVGLLAAQNFYGAGVETAQKTYEGFKANFGPGGPARKALMQVMDNLAAKAARDVRIDVAVTRSINEVVTRVVQTISAPEARAMGGPVDRGSPYLIGEKGPELFVPNVGGYVVSNADLRAGNGTPVGGGVNIVVNAGIGTDGAEVGRKIVDALKAYERRNGRVYASA
jgi:hypothetical protein